MRKRLGNKLKDKVFLHVFNHCVTFRNTGIRNITGTRTSLSTDEQINHFLYDPMFVILHDNIVNNRFFSVVLDAVSKR